MEYVYDGASIECESARVISRDIKLSCFIELAEVGNVRKYTCKRNSESKITKQCVITEKPKYFSAPHRNLHDELRAEDIVVYIPGKIVKEVINYTGRHKAQACETNCFTLAQITRPFPNNLQLKDPRQVPPLMPTEWTKLSQ